MCFKTIKNTVVEKVKDVFGHPPVDVSGKERASPKGRVDEIHRFERDGKWWIEFGPFDIKPRVTGVANTNSMEPLIDDPFTSVLIAVEPSDVIVGDVCTYLGAFGQVIHSVVKILNDGRRYFTFKGLNNKGPDKMKVRDEHIRQALVAEIFTKRKVTLP